MASESKPLTQQASAVPFRIVKGVPQVCLITSVSSGRWGFPKGIIDPGETPPETALKEAYEEAGLRGKILGTPLGTYRYAKWGTTLTVTTFLMQVTHCEDSWQEADRRDRRWSTATEAAELLDRDHLHRMLDLAVDRLASQS